MIKIERKLWIVLMLASILALYLPLPTKNIFGTVVWIETDKERMESELQTLKGRNVSVWMETLLIARYQSSTEGRQWLETPTIERPEFELVIDKYRLQFFQIRVEPYF